MILLGYLSPTPMITARMNQMSDIRPISISPLRPIALIVIASKLFILVHRGKVFLKTYCDMHRVILNILNWRFVKNHKVAPSIMDYGSRAKIKRELCVDHQGGAWQDWRYVKNGMKIVFGHLFSLDCYEPFRSLFRKIRCTLDTLIPKRRAASALGIPLSMRLNTSPSLAMAVGLRPL